ncbi:MAG: peptidase M23, partial [Candidatus Flemingiibacterium sp.]
MPSRLLFEDDQDENSGAQSAELAEEAARTSYHTIKSARDKNKSLPQSEKNTGSNPYSKWRQRLEIKREYAAARAGRNAGTAFHASRATAKAAGQAVDKSDKATRFIAKHKKSVAVIIGIAAVIMIFSTVISSCSVMLSGMSSSITSTTYPCDDGDMLAAEARYCEMEETLRT